MSASKMKAFVSPAIFLALPLFLACQPGDQSMPDGGAPGMEGQPAEQPGQMPGAQPGAELSDADIETMAEVYVALNELQSDADARAQAAPTPEEQNQIQAEATSEMQTVLQDHGLSVDQYQQMVQLINTDENVRARFEEALADVEG